MSRAADRREFPDAQPATDEPFAPFHASPSFESLADALTQIVWISRPDGSVAWFNRRWYEFTGMEPGGTEGARAVWHPEDAAAALLEWERVRYAGLPFEKEYRFRRMDGIYRWFIARAVPIRGEHGAITHWIGSATDITERRQANEALRAERERLALALAAAGMTPWEWDIQGDHFAATEPSDDRTVYTLNGLLSLVHPEDRERVASALRAAAETGAPYEEETRGLLSDGQYRWYLGRGKAIRDATGVVKVVGVTLDITERREGDRRRRFLDSLSERIRPLLDPETVLTQASQSLGHFLGVSRCAYAEVDAAAGTITTRQEYTDGVQSRLGTARLDEFGPEIVDPLRAGMPVMSADVRSDPRLNPKNRANYGGDELPAFLAVPLMKEGVLAAVLAVHQNAPREWTEDEVRLLGIVAERTWLAVENARLYRAARREEERFRALVQASSQMVWTNNAQGMADDMPQWRAYTGQTPEQVRGYGWIDALHPDDRARTAEAWHRAFEGRDVYECDYRIRGRDGNYRWFVSRAVPLLSDDGSLREYVGMSTNVDAERRAEEKQRRIAETLQRSMLITPPEGAFPGLDVTTAYEPAWDEAQVGGDFHDAFALAGGQVAFVVGDVTGKGLEAAAYTAEVKFALRAFLREDPDPASALSRLNRFLLDGQRYDRRSGGALVCLSLAVVDPARGVAVFAVAGSEPPLIVRAADRYAYAVRAGGLLLGTDLGDDLPAEYEGEVVPFAAGDLLVMTTDGVTEARAPGRGASFFGIEGVVAIVTRSAAEPDVPVHAIAATVLGSAKAFAGGEGLNDDVCLLIARHNGASAGVTEEESTWLS